MRSDVLVEGSRRMSHHRRRHLQRDNHHHSRRIEWVVPVFVSWPLTMYEIGMMMMCGCDDEVEKRNHLQRSVAHML